MELVIFIAFLTVAAVAGALTLWPGRSVSLPAERKAAVVPSSSSSSSSSST